MDIHGGERLRSVDGRAGTGYDDGHGAVGAVASGSDGLDGTSGVGGTATDLAYPGSPGTAVSLSARRSHGNTLQSASHRNASSHSLPLVVPTRADLESVKRMMTGDTCIGRGCKQRGLSRSVFWEPIQVVRLWEITGGFHSNSKEEDWLWIYSWVRKPSTCHLDP